MLPPCYLLASERVSQNFFFFLVVATGSLVDENLALCTRKTSARVLTHGGVAPASLPAHDLPEKKTKYLVQKDYIHKVGMLRQNMKICYIRTITNYFSINQRYCEGHCDWILRTF